MFKTIRHLARAPKLHTRFYSTNNLTEGERIIFEKLSEKFTPKKIEVKDISGGCGSMYSIQLESDSFKGKSLVQQHRLVNEVLKEDIKDMHGLQLKTSS
ncbi:bola-like protein [Neoconidiobolus thromboides FSU 785]|nr:bola-like protein [Neoconidiobolus thromboides FSU 785]